MRKTERMFTARERKTAFWALVVATLITVVGMLIDQSWSRPSLGVYGATVSTASLPDVVDARPVS